MHTAQYLTLDCSWHRDWGTGPDRSARGRLAIIRGGAVDGDSGVSGINSNDEDGAVLRAGLAKISAGRSW
jgi:hypothetical protein